MTSRLCTVLKETLHLMSNCISKDFNIVYSADYIAVNT